MQFSIGPHSLWFIAIDFVIGKRELQIYASLMTQAFTCTVYANSFLASLNSRSALRGRGLHSHNEDTSIRINAIDLSGLGTSSEGNDSAGTQSKSPNAPRSARVKITPDDDLGRLEVCSFFAFSWYG